MPFVLSNGTAVAGTLRARQRVARIALHRHTRCKLLVLPVRRRRDLSLLHQLAVVRTLHATLRPAGMPTLCFCRPSGQCVTVNQIGGRRRAHLRCTTVLGPSDSTRCPSHAYTPYTPSTYTPSTGAGARHQTL